MDQRSFNKINISLEDANGIADMKKEKKGHKSKKAAPFPGKSSGESFHKTSSGSFYYIYDKKGKMLEKVKAEKDRINSLKLNDALLVTKYAAKFNINVKELLK